VVVKLRRRLATGELYPPSEFGIFLNNRRSPPLRAIDHHGLCWLSPAGVGSYGFTREDKLLVDPNTDNRVTNPKELREMKNNNPGPAQRLIRLCAMILVLFLSPVTIVSAALVDNGDGTVTDTETSLMWQQATMDRTGDGTPDQMTWGQALDESEHLTLAGYSDWRLPDYNELSSIVDYSRYHPAIDTTVFPDTVSSHYWSSTTYLIYANYAWRVDFDYGNGNYNDKSNSYYVRAVRGGQCGSFGEFGSFAFDPISSPVEPATCIPVRVEAHTAAGALDTGFNGDVSLDINYGWVAPTSIHFSGGVANESCVKVYGVGNHKQLTVQGVGRHGASNAFVSGTTNCTGRVAVYTNDEATVILNHAAGGEYAREDTDITGVAQFYDVPCDKYYLRAEKSGYVTRKKIPVYVRSSGVFDANITNIHLNAVGSGTPVVLIPGILGSAHRGIKGKYPWFKGQYGAEEPKDLRIHHPLLTGWSKMEGTLMADFRTVIRCPWDWRNKNVESMKESVERYLIPAINEALTHSSTGKVDIVAHSMGGLLARAYIQSDLYRGDVNRLALVAVPNLGSANPYCLWEAGDINTTALFVGGEFYENTIKKLWKKTYHKHNPKWGNACALDIRKFLHTYSPSMLQLMFTGNFLKDGNGTPYTVQQTGYVNTWLKALNDGTHGFVSPGTVFSRPDVSGNKVKTRVFAGKLSEKKTLRWITTDMAASNMYPDGKPLDALSKYYCENLKKKEIEKKSAHHIDDKGDGDGTVPWESAVYPVAQGWADREQKASVSNEHGFIMKSFKDEIRDFLDGGGNGTTSASVPAGKSLAFTKLAKGKAATTTPELIFSVVGDMRLLVTDSQGRKSGIVEATGELVNEIPETEIEVNDSGASIEIVNAAAEAYTVEYYGLRDSDFSLYITAVDTSGRENEDDFDGFRPDQKQTLVVSYDPAHADQTTEQPVVAAPTEYESTSYNCGAGKCAKLIWKPSAASGVTGYVIYRQLADEPFYTEMARVGAAATSYNTGEPWDSIGGYPVNGYAVSAIKADDTESFFAKEKNYVINKFPWPMFLPAVTGGR